MGFRAERETQPLKESLLDNPHGEANTGNESGGKSSSSTASGVTCAAFGVACEAGAGAPGLSPGPSGPKLFFRKVRLRGPYGEDRMEEANVGRRAEWAPLFRVCVYSGGKKKQCSEGETKGSTTGFRIRLFHKEAQI